MIKEAIEKIQQLVLGNADLRQVNGRDYSLVDLKPVKAPVQSDLCVASLTAIEDYFRENPDGVSLDKAIVRVGAPNLVEVLSPVIEPWLTRHGYLEAKIDHRSFQLERYHPIDQFIIAMQTYFVPTEVTAQIIQVVGNLVAETSVKVMDDGMSQEVTAKSGVARVSNVILPNPVVLAPYRTFLEVAQPESKFILRIDKKGTEPQAALFEADGGNWQSDCRIRCRDWLRTHLPAGTIILA